MFINNTINKRKPQLIETYANTTNMLTITRPELCFLKKEFQTIYLAWNSNFEEALTILIFTILDFKERKNEI